MSAPHPAITQTATTPPPGSINRAAIARRDPASLTDAVFGIASNRRDDRPFALLAQACKPAPSDWMDDPETQAILATCAGDAPASKSVFTTYAVTRDEHRVYVGRRAERLEAIRDAAGDAALQHHFDTDDYSAFRRWCDSPTVVQAIDATLAQPNGPASTRDEEWS